MFSNEKNWQWFINDNRILVINRFEWKGFELDCAPPSCAFKQDGDQTSSNPFEN